MSRKPSLACRVARLLRWRSVKLERRLLGDRWGVDGHGTLARGDEDPVVAKYEAEGKRRGLGEQLERLAKGNVIEVQLFRVDDVQLDAGDLNVFTCQLVQTFRDFGRGFVLHLNRDLHLE